MELQEASLQHDSVLILGDEASYSSDLDVADVIDIPIPVPADDIESGDDEDKRKGKRAM